MVEEGFFYGGVGGADSDQEPSAGGMQGSVCNVYFLYVSDDEQKPSAGGMQGARVLSVL